MRIQIPLLALLVAAATGHSWNYNPTPRDYGLRPAEIDNEVVTEGCLYTRAEGWDLTYSKGGHLAMRKVSRGRDLCVSWTSNGHFREPGRGWVRLSLSSGGDSQPEFDQGILLANVDYAAYEGVRVRIPEDTPLGLAVLQFHWDYCGAHRFFVSCSDIVILEKDDPAGQNYGLRGTEKPEHLGHCLAHLPPIPPPSSDPNICAHRPLPEPDSESDEEETCHCHCPPCGPAEPLPSVPAGRCLDDDDCPDSYCKDWQVPEGGLWFCQ
jgi:hypothetical protein